MSDGVFEGPSEAREETYSGQRFWHVETQRGNIVCQVSRVDQPIGFQKLSMLGKVFQHSTSIFHFIRSASSRGPVTKPIATKIFDKVKAAAFQFFEKEAEGDLLVVGPMTAIINDEVEVYPFGGLHE